MIGTINKEKLIELRGTKSLKTISKESNNAFSDVALLHWEKGDREPTNDSLKALLKVYGCKLEDILDTANLTEV
jgi:transcriptional regulator with XRE-family HTH domain